MMRFIRWGFKSVIGVAILGALVFGGLVVRAAMIQLQGFHPHFDGGIIPSSNTGSSQSGDVKGSQKTKAVTLHTTKRVSTGHLTAPKSAKAGIVQSNGLTKWISATTWNEFVRTHPKYGESTNHGTYLAIAPNLIQQKTGDNLYFLVGGGYIDHNVPYGLWKADKSRLLREGWKYYHDKNEYLLLAPGYRTVLANGKKVNNP